MEAICSSQTSIDFQWTTRHYIPEDITVKKSTLQHYASVAGLMKKSSCLHDRMEYILLGQNIPDLIVYNILPFIGFMCLQ
jgi:hypothetical protein